MSAQYIVDVQAVAKEGKENSEESLTEAYEKWLKSATDKERELADRALGFRIQFFLRPAFVRPFE